MMTDWFREVRVLTEARAEKSGRPYPLGLRVPGNYRMLRHLGIDVAALVEEGAGLRPSRVPALHRGQVPQYAG